MILIESIYSCRQNTQAVSSYGVGNLLNANRGDHFLFCCHLQKLLGQQIVIVAAHELGDIPDNCKDIKFALRNGLIGQINVMQIQTKQVVGHDSHLLVSLHIVDVDSVHVVECLVERFRYLDFDIDFCIENADFFELN